MHFPTGGNTLKRIHILTLALTCSLAGTTHTNAERMPFEGLFGEPVSFERCLRTYGTEHLDKLKDGRCFGGVVAGRQAAFTICWQQVTEWEKLKTMTSAQCLQILQKVVQNPSTSTFKWNDNFTFEQLRENVAYMLLQNDVFSETLSKLDRAEFEVKAKPAAARFKK